MTDTEGNIVEGAATLSALSGNVTVGDQSIQYAAVQIQVETAAHKRRVEQQRLDHELKEAQKDNYFRRWRELITFLVIIVGVAGLLLWSFYIAATTTDPTSQTWAQGFATALAGAIGGAFAGYAVGGRK